MATGTVVPAIPDWSMKAHEAASRFEVAWEAEVAASSLSPLKAQSSSFCVRYKTAPPTKRTPSILRAVWVAFKSDLLLAAFLKGVWGILVLFSVSFFVRSLLLYIRFRFNDPEHTPDEAAHGVILAIFFFVTAMILSIALQQMTFVSARLGLRVRTAVATTVYRKSLVMDRRVLTAPVEPLAAGEAPPLPPPDLVALVAIDCAKLGDACIMLQYLWSGAVEALAILGVLLIFVGRAALPGLAVVLALVPVQFLVGLATANARKKVTTASGARVALMDEVLRAIKLVKMYAWERQFAARVGTLRASETAVAAQSGALKTLNLALVFVLPPLIALSIFGIHSLETPLEASLAFTTLSLFNTLRLPLVQLPKGLRAWAEATSAAARLAIFLQAPDRSKNSEDCTDPEVKSSGEALGVDSVSVSVSSAPTVTVAPVYDEILSAGEVLFEAASFMYGKAKEASLPTPPELLREISLRLKRGTITVVAGPVASGKSNLMLAILGQMTHTSGTVRSRGTTALVPQTPWCAHGTIRDNILFGRAWNEDRYRAVLFACALERDLTIMAEGDLTEIGERGMNLSGGQKQRVALARAAYSGADLLLLDSPLSAVDAYTAQHIMTHCIEGLCISQGATVVLVSHQTELFGRAHQLVVMDGGRASYVGLPTTAAIRAHFPSAGPMFENSSDPDLSETEESRTVVANKADTLAQLPLTPRSAMSRELGSAPFARMRAPTPPRDATSPDQVKLLLPGSMKLEAFLAQRRAAAAMSSAAPASAAAPRSLSDAPPNAYYALIHEFKWWILVPVVGVFAITQVVRIFSDIWISLWVARRYPDRTEDFYIGTYAGYVATFFVLLLARGATYYVMGLSATTSMHDAMFRSILAAPMSFFTSTPLGKVLSVFSKDMDAVDESLLDNLHMVGIYLMILVTTIAVIVRVLPIFAVIAGALLVLSAIVFRYYLIASQALKMRAGAAAAAVVTHASETSQGIVVIQAFRAEARFAAAHDVLEEASQTAGLTLELLQMWLTFRQDTIGCSLVLATCLLCVLQESRLPPADAGLAVSNSFQILLFLSLMFRGAADVHAHMGSVDRVLALSRVQGEAGDEGKGGEWRPVGGEVNFTNVTMSYHPSSPAVLKGVSFHVLPGEKLGVVGRSGAGKSSLIMALFRLAPPVSSGTCVGEEYGVHVDGTDISLIGLSELRRGIAIIPQEPVMFAGTLRSNLDPFDEKTNEELESALERCLLAGLLTAHPAGLMQPVAQYGENFSLGQQQLVCLTRALLNTSHLLLLDEATAALDKDTDAAVQRVLRTHFADRTVSCVICGVL